jgi:hypothetical protein
MNGKDLLDILLKYQYEGNLENMEIYYSAESEGDWSLKQIHSHEIDSEGDLILHL